MRHPLADDPSVPAVLRAAFARVKFLVVRHYADGTEWSYNVNPTQANQDELMERERARIGTVVDSKVLVDVELRPVN